MGLPDVNITLGNGRLGRSQATADGVAGIILTGAAVAGKLELNKHYVLSGTADLAVLGITTVNNPLLDKEVKAFYKEAGDGAELHLLIVSEATTLTSMCAAEAASPLSKLIAESGYRVRLIGVNKIAPAEYEADVTQGIDGDAITAASAAQACLDGFTSSRKSPARLLMPAAAWSGTTESLYKPVEGSYNRVRFILASDDPTNKTAAIGQILGRNAKIAVHQSDARVKSGAIAAQGWATNGKTYKEIDGLNDILHDAGYTIYRGFPTKNGCYLNDNQMAAPKTDDYSSMNYGRVIDKAYLITYATYIEEICENVQVDKDGYIPVGLAKDYEGMITRAVKQQMAGEISDFTAYIDPKQNLLSSESMKVVCSITPTGTIKSFDVELSLDNPANSNA